MIDSKSAPDDEREFARLVNQTDWKLIHQRLGHPGMKRFERIVKEMGLAWNKGDYRDILEHCETAKSVKRQNRKLTPIPLQIKAAFRMRRDTFLVCDIGLLK